MAKTKENWLPEAALSVAADCLKAMAHPVRLRMVEVLMRGDRPVHAVAELCGLSPAQTCGHLRLLKARGLLASVRKGRAVFYRVASRQLPGLIQCIRRNCQTP